MPPTDRPAPVPQDKLPVLKPVPGKGYEVRTGQGFASSVKTKGGQ